MMALRVIFAVYGALRDGTPRSTQAAIVTDALQDRLDADPDGVVKIDNNNLGIDPAVGVQKHFAALVEVNGVPRPFACLERQTIDFFMLQPPASASFAYRMGPFGTSHGGGSGTVRFRGSLLSASGEGSRPVGDEVFDESKDWVGHASDNFFVARTTIGNLKLGRWSVTVESPPGTFRATCQVNLLDHQVNDSVNFQENLGGCARDTFPGGN